jgi:hypothetical protein
MTCVGLRVFLVVQAWQQAVWNFFYWFAENKTVRMGMCVVVVVVVVEYQFQPRTSHGHALGRRTKKQVKTLVRVFSKQVQ